MACRLVRGCIRLCTGRGRVKRPPRSTRQYSASDDIPYSKEGGEKAIEPTAYAELNIKAAQTGYVDLVDVEIFTGDDIVKKIIDGAHAAGVKVIASNHDFFKNSCKKQTSSTDCAKCRI